MFVHHRFEVKDALKEGGSVTFFTAGGGGYGPAGERPRKLIERDRRLGYVAAMNGS